MHFSLLSLAALASAVAAQTAVNTFTEDPELSTLLSLAGKYPELVKTLESLKNVTVLAPTNKAFAEWSSTEIGKTIASSDEAVPALLTYHVLGAEVPASAFTTTPAFVPTLLNTPAYTNVTGGQVVEGKLNGTTIEITSGLLQVSKVVKGDIPWNGGIIHKIDRVLTFPQLISTTAAAAGLTELVEALKATSLVKVVDETPDLTVFAPNNAAFEKLGPAAANLTVDQLTEILGYHVVAAGSPLYSTDFTDGAVIKTLQGQSVKVSIKDGNVFVNDAKVIIPDVLVANGVVHVIDSVLLPNLSGNSTGPTGPTATGNASPSSSATNTGSSSAPSSSPITPFESSASTSKILGAFTSIVAALTASFFLL